MKTKSICNMQLVLRNWSWSFASQTFKYIFIPVIGETRCYKAPDMWDLGSLTLHLHDTGSMTRIHDLLVIGSNSKHAPKLPFIFIQNKITIILKCNPPLLKILLILNYLLCSHARVSYYLVPLVQVRQCLPKQLLLMLVQISSIFPCQASHLRLDLLHRVYFNLLPISSLFILTSVLSPFCFSGLVRVKSM